MWKGDKPLFAGNKYAGLSDMGLYAIGGILKHAKSLCAFTNPTTNSYKRLVPGYEAPVNLVYSSRNRSAAIRIPMYSDNPKTKRHRIPLPRQLAAIRTSPSAPSRWPPSTASRTRSTPATRWTRTSTTSRRTSTKRSAPPPASLEEALDELENDHDFLLKGDVFTADVIHYWIKYKRENEVDAIRMRPHPYEFCMYFDI